MHFLWIVLLLIAKSSIHGQVEIGILRTGVAVNSLSNVHYLNGNCTWTFTFTFGSTQTMGTSEGPELLLFETDEFTFQCAVNGSVQLSGFTTVYDIIPAPVDVTLLTNNKTLQWTNILQPSDLPPDFKIVHNYNISYQVHVYDKDGVSSVNVPGNYFNLLNECEEQNFTVQTVINDELYSDNSSVVSFEGPTFANVSVSFQLEDGINLTISMSFALLWKQCLSYFTVTIPGLMEFNVTTPDIENGSANFTVSLNDSMVDVCTPRQAIFHGSGIEKSIEVEIQLPSDCSTEATPSSATYTVASTRSVMPSPSATTTPTIDPTHTDRAPDDSSTEIVPVIIAVAVVVLIIIAALVLIIVVYIFRKKKHGGQSQETQDSSLIGSDEPSNSTSATMPEEKNKPIIYSTVIPATRPEEKPKVFDVRVNYETVDHLKTEELRQEQEASRTDNPVLSSKDPKGVGLLLDTHLELLVKVLSPVKAKWYNLGVQLNLSENFLDETQTNIETDVECLSEMMKNWLQYHEPSMKVLNHALSQIDHPPIAFDTSVQGFVVVSDEEGRGKMGSAHTNP